MDVKYHISQFQGIRNSILGTYCKLVTLGILSVIQFICSQFCSTWLFTLHSIWLLKASLSLAVHSITQTNKVLLTVNKLTFPFMNCQLDKKKRTLSIIPVSRSVLSRYAVHTGITQEVHHKKYTAVGTHTHMHQSQFLKAGWWIGRWRELSL